jgi:hypothetical protein
MMSKEKLNIDNAFIELEKQYYNIDMKIERIRSNIEIEKFNEDLMLNISSFNIPSLVSKFNFEREKLVEKNNLSYLKLIEILNKHKQSNLESNQVKIILEKEKLQFNMFNCLSKNNRNLVKITYKNDFDALKKIKYSKLMPNLINKIDLKENLRDKNKFSIEILSYDKVVLFFKDNNKLEILSNNNFINNKLTLFERKFRKNYFCNFKVWNSCIIMVFETYVYGESNIVCIFDEYLNIKVCKKIDDLNSILTINSNDFIYWSKKLEKYVTLNLSLEKTQSFNYIPNIDGPLLHLRDNLGYFLSSQNINNPGIVIYSFITGQIIDKESWIPVNTLSSYKIFFDSKSQIYIYMMDPLSSIFKIYCYDHKGIFLFCTELNYYLNSITPNLVDDMIICFHEVNQTFIAYI